jgi:N-sulfoglucosamine sulfohydrolase
MLPQSIHPPPCCAILAFLVFPLLPSPSANAEQKGDARPNILLAIADDWSFPHAGIYGDKTVATPTFDRLAKEGVLFTHAFCAAPSCTPSRAGLLTGQAIHRLEESGNLWSTLQAKFEVYPDLLEKAGYAVGLQGKGWGPGNVSAGGRTRNPAGPSFKSFDQFIASVPQGKPFCFWFGSSDPHRPYDKGSGASSGLRPDTVSVPPFLPDTPEVRSDILDYYFEVQRFDRDVGAMIKRIEAAGRLDNTIVVMTSDNGFPFPRAKATVYDAGTRMPLAIRWGAKVKGGRTVDDVVSLCDLAPTFLDAAGLAPPPAMTGRTLLPLLRCEPQPGRDTIFLERERHANVRKGDLTYPVRAVRTTRYLYVRNVCPDRWPAGDPEKWKAVGPFGDVDGSPTKDLILDRREEPAMAAYFKLAFGKRPAEELYDLSRDPHQVDNVAGKPEYAEAQQALRAELGRWMADTADPRATGDTDRWDRYPYYGK